MKHKLCLLCVITILCLSGCSSNNKELEEKIKLLEDKITALEEANNNSNLITKEELIGVWESSSGVTITINEDGSYTSSGAQDIYLAYSLNNEFIRLCNSSYPIKSCIEEIEIEDKNEKRKIIPVGYTYNYFYQNNKMIFFQTNNDIFTSNPISVVWTKKQ